MDALDERLSAHQAPQNKDCVYRNVSPNPNVENELKKGGSALKEKLNQLSGSANAAYIRTGYGSYYINKKQGIYKDLTLFPSDIKSLNELFLVGSFPNDTSHQLSSESLTRMHDITKTHHIDEIDRIKENFSEFQKTVLPYLEARKILIYAGSQTYSTLLSTDYEGFGDSMKKISENLERLLEELKNNSEKLKEIETNLEKEERIALEKQKEEAKNKALEKQARREASKKDTSVVKSFFDFLPQGNESNLEVKIDNEKQNLGVYLTSTSSGPLAKVSESVKLCPDNEEKCISISEETQSLTFN